MRSARRSGIGEPLSPRRQSRSAIALPGIPKSKPSGPRSFVATALQRRTCPSPCTGPSRWSQRSSSPCSRHSRKGSLLINAGPPAAPGCRATRLWKSDKHPESPKSERIPGPSRLAGSVSRLPKSQEPSRPPTSRPSTSCVAATPSTPPSPCALAARSSRWTGSSASAWPAWSRPACPPRRWRSGRDLWRVCCKRESGFLTNPSHFCNAM